MDKKNTILGLLFITAGIGYMFWQSYHIQKNSPNRSNSTEPVRTFSEEAIPSDKKRISTTNPPDSQEIVPLETKDLFKESPADLISEAPLPQEQTVTLANEYIEVTLTNRGGAIKTVKFLKTKRGQSDDYVFNEAGYLPALSLSLSADTGNLREFALNYTVEQLTGDSVTFVLDTAEGLVVRRSYRIETSDSDAEPYVIRHQTGFENSSGTSKALNTIYFNLGTAHPLSEEMIGVNALNVGYYDGNAAEFVPIKKLTGSKGFLGIGGHLPRDELTESGQIEWASVKNQFFASVLSSETVADHLHIAPVRASKERSLMPESSGITGSLGYDLGTLATGENRVIEARFYVGPKEFKRLQALGNDQDLVMQFGKIFGFFSKLLLVFMYGIHSIVPSWGWSIVIMTIAIKLIFWPLTAKSGRAQKRMARIQKPLADLKEKYKGDMQKMQKEIWNLYKEHQINPLAGCLPILIQMPIFLGLFYMLRSAAELRYEPFLWVSDLSAPDTLTEVAGIPINLLPLIMSFTMFLQMRMMPVSPTADPVQRSVFKFLPFIFVILLYNFSSGLVLYWTCQNILTIIQQKIINNAPDEPLEPVPVPVSKNRKMKGATLRNRPKRK